MRAKNQQSTSAAKLQPVHGIPDVDYFTVREVASLVGCSTQTVRKLIRQNQLPAVNLGVRNTRIRRADIEALFTEPETNLEFEIKDCYTMSEVMEKYGISDKALYDMVKRNKINKVQHGRSVYVPRIIIDKLLT